MRYFDTGVLLKLYLPEPRAAEAVAHVRSCPNVPPITPLHELEMRSALRQKAGRGEITQAECGALLAQMETDMAGGVHERFSGRVAGGFCHSGVAFHGAWHEHALPLTGHAACGAGSGAGCHGVLHL